jgi:hypothetical protein
LNGTAFGVNNALIFAHDKVALVRVGNVRIRVERGCAAFVICDSRQVHVLSLHDKATGDVSVAIAETIADLRSGEALAVRAEGECFNPTGPLAYLPARNLSESVTASGQVATTWEFSLPAAMSTLGAVRALGVSAERNERALYAKLAKNACVLQTVGARKGSYRIVNQL